MRTLDINVHDIVARRLSTYPEGSVSRRDVVATLPYRGDDDGWELNGRLTKAVYDYWEQTMSNKPPHHLKSKDELTAIAQQVVADLSA